MKNISKIEHHFVVTVSQKENGKWQYAVDNDLRDTFITQGFYYDREEKQWTGQVSDKVQATDNVIGRILSDKLGR